MNQLLLPSELGMGLKCSGEKGKQIPSFYSSLPWHYTKRILQDKIVMWCASVSQTFTNSWKKIHRLTILDRGAPTPVSTPLLFPTGNRWSAFHSVKITNKSSVITTAGAVGNCGSLHNLIIWVLLLCFYNTDFQSAMSVSALLWYEMCEIYGFYNVYVNVYDVYIYDSPSRCHN